MSNNKLKVTINREHNIIILNNSYKEIQPTTDIKRIIGHCAGSDRSLLGCLCILIGFSKSIQNSPVSQRVKSAIEKDNVVWIHGSILMTGWTTIARVALVIGI